MVPAPRHDARAGQAQRRAGQHERGLGPILRGMQRQRLHAQVEDRLQPLAGHEQRGHQRDARDRLGGRRGALGARDVTDARLDVSLDVGPGAQHLHQQRADDQSGGQRGDPLVERLVRDLQPQPCAAQAGDDRGREADAHAPDEPGAPGLLQVRDDDPDDQERFDSFAEGDQQRLQHRRREL